VGILFNWYWLRAFLLHGVAASTESASGIAGLEVVTAVDVGANRGQFSLLLRHCFPGARIIAFEPLPDPASRFRELFEGDSKVHIHQCAIGPNLGEATMHVSLRDDSSSLLPITESQTRLFPGTGERGTVTVDVGPLDSSVDASEIVEPALLKVDVQGFELEALKGCEGLLRCFRYVLVECSHVELYAGQAIAADVISWLERRGYVLSGVFNVSKDREGSEIQGDFLFERT
jgi:FkbM family methyltransferase